LLVGTKSRARHLPTTTFTSMHALRSLAFRSSSSKQFRLRSSASMRQPQAKDSRERLDRFHLHAISADLVVGGSKPRKNASIDRCGSSALASRQSYVSQRRREP